jgi:hypothetical protein
MRIDLDAQYGYGGQVLKLDQRGEVEQAPLSEGNRRNIAALAAKIGLVAPGGEITPDK